MYELDTSHYVRAAIVAAAGAALVGVAAAIVLPPRPFGGILILAIALLGGAGAASGLARAFDFVTNGKRGRPLQLMAAGAIAGAAFVRLIVSDDVDLIARDASGIVFVVIGVVVAWNRLA